MRGGAAISPIEPPACSPGVRLGAAKTDDDVELLAGGFERTHRSLEQIPSPPVDDTPRGYGVTVRGDRKQAKIARLNRIAGQARGLARMVAEDRACIDILHQIQAVKAALGRAEGEVLRDHAAHCVADAIAAGDAAEQRRKLDELVELFDRARR
jgi:CsoR family transcriptional regulator, copper-sensing transcriptional repressor